jgi:hypothetical protein
VTVENCAGGVPQACKPKPSGTEVCDGKDNDCDGAADEELGSTTCGAGECTVTVENCAGGVPQTCKPKPSGTEVCDGKDNDCDGAADEELGSTTCGAGECTVTVENCAGGVPQACKPKPSGTEVCGNGKDDDCDGEIDEAAHCPAGCADFTREGFADVAKYPKIAACAGSFTGWIDEAGAKAICAPGWHVCNGGDAVVHTITHPEAKAFSGCFAFDAAHDCNACYTHCRDLGCKNCCVSNYESDADMAGMGASCSDYGAGQSSCLAGGRIDASTNTFGCKWAASVTGVVCCL